MVTDFEEKPSTERMQQLEGVSKNATAEDPFEASMGIYMFKRDVLIKLLDRHRAGTDTKPDAHFGYDVIPHALEDGLRIMAHHHPGYWRVSLSICLRDIIPTPSMSPLCRACAVGRALDTVAIQPTQCSRAQEIVCRSCQAESGILQASFPE